MMLEPLRSNSRRQAVVKPATFPAPVEGWDALSPLAAMKNLRAVQLKNWFPQPGYVEVRKGWQRHARTIVGSTTSVETLMAWNGPSSAKMFAAGGGSIYETTSSGTVGAAELSGLSLNRWQWVNMTTSAGAFLFLVNGTDAARHYNGTTWTSPSITGVSSTDLIHVNVHKKRLWFVQKNTTKAWYLATEAVAGAATSFELGSNFDQGGYLVAMATWTLDYGAGPDDYAVFISSKGQLAVYQGTDPASALTWELVGVFNLAAPIGRRCFTKFGSSPLLITVAGVLQLNLSIKSDEAQLTSTALTARISNSINTAARLYDDNFGWELCVYPRGTRLVLNIPTAENSTAIQYVMNTITGAWCEFDGHNANTFLVFNDELYFGSNIGTVAKADQTSADGQTAITALGQTAYNPLGSAGQLKRFTMAQPLIMTEGTARVSVGVSADFIETETISTPVGVVAATSLWDSAVWDTDVWGGEPIFVNDWTSTPALGRFASVKFTAKTGVEAGIWGAGDWEIALWGIYAPEHILQVNGFVVLSEAGGHI